MALVHSFTISALVNAGNPAAIGAFGTISESFSHEGQSYEITWAFTHTNGFQFRFTANSAALAFIAAGFQVDTGISGQSPFSSSLMENILSIGAAQYRAFAGRYTANESFTVQISTADDHSVNVGAAAWAFAVPALSVEHRRADATTDHEITPAAASWAFAVGQLRGLLSRAGAPSAPPQPRASDVTLTTAHLSWFAPDDGGAPILRYEIQINGGPWISTGSIGTDHDLTGLEPGTTYRVSVRAVTAMGAGPPSAAVLFGTNPIVAPSPPLFPRLEAGPGLSLDLLWEPSLSDGGGAITRYEAFFCDEANQHCGWELVWTDGERRQRYRGLREGGRYRVMMRARNSAGVSDASGAVDAVVYRQPVAVTLPRGSAIPLGDHDRQSLIVRLDGQDCRIRVWWVPSDSGWWGSLEVPANTPRVTGRRLGLNAGLLDRLDGILPGNLVMRDLGGTGVEPRRDAFRAPTHALRWEPDSA